ncbi:TetR/AcrR family transcriptional regulator [Clostridium chromiireducens]|uniref:HTH-type transcriptional regulator BetI n=1 Tax=Clostridium chromiireducens TaxID=225345 RepID=A0A1V4J048_9CLOT|nr:TetR/AcrR family transcriptional regulator [Clostridium chromiireducens]OPJ65672.1 HTH-type transcriptional regulator BetI [Clostridium chromiireducens]RII32071.1 TetR/AcrR family transcriptional regulator [Clostridium chromiireducens]
MGENDAKEKLIDVTIRMICEGKKPSEITVKDITEKAGLGNGMVNYHFQSKDNLIRLAVKKVMNCATKSLSEKTKSKDGEPPAYRLAFILKEVANFIADNSEISKIAILDDLETNQMTAHLLGSEESYNKCLKELYGDDMHKFWVKNYLIAGYLNYIFLKAENIKNEMGFDFYNKDDREKAIENLVEELVNCKMTKIK